MGHPAFMIEFGHGTHTGLRRTRNEDTYYADAGLGLFLVVDGMGGHQHGEVASATARDGVVAQVAAGQSLIDAIQRVNEALIARSSGLAESRPMGTTIAAVRISGRAYEAAWVGDSRIYRWDGSLERLSHDHSIVEALVEAGELTEAQGPGASAAECPDAGPGGSPHPSSCTSAWHAASFRRGRGCCCVRMG